MKQFLTLWMVLVISVSAMACSDKQSEENITAETNVEENNMTINMQVWKKEA